MPLTSCIVFSSRIGAGVAEAGRAEAERNMSPCRVSQESD